MNKFKTKMKSLATKTKGFIKKRPKAIGAILAVAILATGGNASGFVETSDVLNIAVQIVSAVS